MTKSKNNLVVNKSKKYFKPKYTLKVLNEFQDFKKWLKKLVLFEDLKKFIYICRYEKNHFIKIYLFTEKHVYTIIAHLPDEEQLNGYLGGYCSNRTHIAGEEWIRGFDLPDGPYNIDTWEKIKSDILAHELIPVAKNSSFKIVKTK